jgi:serine/threonine protein kinase
LYIVILAFREIVCLHAFTDATTLPVRGWNFGPNHTDSEIVIFSHFMGQGSLSSLKPTELSADDVVFYLYGIARGMSKLHSRQMVHRDLKPANLLLDANGYPIIADMGFAKWAPGVDASLALGTVGFRAPEVVALTRYSFVYDRSVDVYSFGKVVEYFTAEGSPGGALMTGEFALLIGRCTHVNPAIRPSFAEIVDFFEQKMGDRFTPGSRMAQYRDFLEREITRPENLAVWEYLLRKLSPSTPFFWKLAEVLKPQERKNLHLPEAFARIIGHLVFEEGPDREEFVNSVMGIWENAELGGWLDPEALRNCVPHH